MFDQSNYGPVGGEQLIAPSIYSYRSEDSMAEIVSPFYFNEKQFQLEEGDLIYIVSRDSEAWKRVSIDSDKNITVEDMSLDLQKTAFGELSVADKTPIVQTAAQYGLGAKMRVLTSGTGAAAGANSDSLFYATSGTGAFNFATTFSKRAGAYKAGMGLLGEFTMVCESPIADAVQRAGFVNATDGYEFGYLGTEFGIFYRHHGQQDIRELQLTVAAGGAETATVQIDGTNYNVSLTGGGTVNDDAREIADSLTAETTGPAALWAFQQVGDTVVSRDLVAGTNSGSFSYSSTGTSAGTWSQVVAGVSVTEEFTAQSDWNGIDVSSWFNPLFGNVYQIQMQYLGFGNIFFAIEDPETGHFVGVHEIKYPNSNLIPSVANPSFRIGWTAGNRGATTTKTVSGGSCAVFVEGQRIFTEAARSLSNTKAGVGTTATNLLTIENREVYGTKVNLASVIPILVTAETDSTKGAVIEINIGASVAGDTDFEYVNETESVVIYDTAGTTVTDGQNIATFLLGPSGTNELDLSKYNIELLPGEAMTISGRVTSGASSDVGASIVWQEDI